MKDLGFKCFRGRKPPGENSEPGENPGRYRHCMRTDRAR